MAAPTTSHKLGAEALGTFWLVLGGVGTAVLAGARRSRHARHRAGLRPHGPDRRVRVRATSRAGTSTPPSRSASPRRSGSTGRTRPATSRRSSSARRWPAASCYVIASGADGFDASASGFGTNGYGDHSPGGYSLLAVIITEIVLTAFFLYVIFGATAKRAAVGFSGLAIGLALTLIHLISIPVDGTSVNPARSLGVAVVRRS